MFSDEGFKSPHSDTQLSGAPCASDHVEVHHHDAGHNDRHNTLRSGEWLRASIRPVTMTIPWGLRVPPMHSITLTKSPKHPLNSLNTKPPREFWVGIDVRKRLTMHYCWIWSREVVPWFVSYIIYIYIVKHDQVLFDCRTRFALECIQSCSPRIWIKVNI